MYKPDSENIQKANFQEENTWNIFNDDIESHIIITVPKYYFFEKIDIEAGSSQLNISDIQTKSFDLLLLLDY